MLINTAPYIYANKLNESAETSGEVLFHEEGVDGTVTVVKSFGELALKIEGKVDASSGGTLNEAGEGNLREGDMRTQILTGHLPLFLQSQPAQVLVVGLASGVTVGAVEQHPWVKVIDCAEISGSVLRASELFKEYNHDALNDPRLTSDP